MNGFQRELESRGKQGQVQTRGPVIKGRLVRYYDETIGIVVVALA